MALSSNSIIHFTNEKDNLKGILRDNFNIYYCKESLYVDEDSVDYHVPMVSFCDIPLSVVKNHINSYGSYGIGLTKLWAIKNGLNPVLYMQANSKLSNSYFDTIANYYTSNSFGELNDKEKALLDIIRYQKNYQGDLHRKGHKTISDYRFSDEREWRFVPDWNCEFQMLLDGSEFHNDVLRKKNISLLQKMKLEFEPNDIKYIIIEKEDEIEEFLEVLQKDKGRKYSFNDIQRLTTRIITADQIKTDF